MSDTSEERATPESGSAAPKEGKVVGLANDPELEAITSVVRALEKLDPGARARVVQYVFDRLGLTEPTAISDEQRASPARFAPSSEVAPASKPRDIRTLKEEKGPRTANEMVALMGFYLSDVAPPGERREEFDRADVKKYFTHAQFPLPHSLSMALVHAKNAGYIDQGSSKGVYRLNPVGHNLVVHSLPASGAGLARPVGRARSRKKMGKPRKHSGPGST